MEQFITGVNIMKLVIQGKPKEIAELTKIMQTRKNKSNCTELLEKQLQLLSKDSERHNGDVAKMTSAMAKISRFLQN